ncbi:hypothetical protein BKA69DRAFT_853814 [Paraphysoderma sedebokerense]|nr:hypothetical protein BKA69DRAFT_853814 [Paraphysoderma sedebokerense]
MPDNRTSSYLRDFKTTNNCPNYTHDKRRFLVSIYCYDVVSLSSNCPGNRGAVRPLCKESCLSYVASTQNTFNDPNMCPPSQSANQNRTIVLQGLSSQCDRFPFSGAEGQCLKGDQVEPDTCGT